jgi:hypothetical protein
VWFGSRALPCAVVDLLYLMLGDISLRRLLISQLLPTILQPTANGNRAYAYTPHDRHEQKDGCAATGTTAPGISEILYTVLSDDTLFVVIRRETYATQRTVCFPPPSLEPAEKLERLRVRTSKCGIL